MAVHKRTRRGVLSWYYEFDLPGRAPGPDGKRPRARKFGFATRKAAIDAEAEARREELRKNPAQAPAAESLGHMIEDWLDLHCEGNLSGKSTERYRELLGYLNPQLLGLAPDDVKPIHLTAEWKRLSAEGGRRRDGTPRPLGASVRHVASTLSSAYGWAIQQQIAKENPVKYSAKPKKIKKRAVTVASRDLDVLLATEGGFWCRPAYMAAAEKLGKRRGELCALRWVDWQDGRMIISRSLSQYTDKATGEERLEFKSTKADEIHSVTVPGSLVPILVEHRERQNEQKRLLGAGYQDNDLIFCEQDGRPFHPDSVSSSVSQICRKLKLPKGTSLHSLRHTHASVLLQKKVPVAAVSQRLGHSSIRTTLDIYAHWLRDDDDQAAQAYDDYRKEHSVKEKHEVQ